MRVGLLLGVGVRVGLEVGVRVRVADEVGVSPTGLTLGVAVGVAVRVAVGVAVRVAVRVKVGLLGSSVGVAVRVGDAVGVTVREGVGVAERVAVRVDVTDGVAVRVAVRVDVRVAVRVGLGGGQTASVCSTMLSMKSLPVVCPFRLRAMKRSLMGSVAGLMVPGNVSKNSRLLAPTTKGWLAEAMFCWYLPTAVAAPCSVISR